MGRQMEVDEVVSRLGMSGRGALWQMYYRGDGPPRIRITARRFLWDEESLEKWMKSREESATRAVA